MIGVDSYAGSKILTPFYLLSIKHPWSLSSVSSMEIDNSFEDSFSSSSSAGEFDEEDAGKEKSPHHIDP